MPAPQAAQEKGPAVSAVLSDSPGQPASTGTSRESPRTWGGRSHVRRNELSSPLCPAPPSTLIRRAAVAHPNSVTSTDRWPHADRKQHTTAGLGRADQRPWISGAGV